MKNKHLAEGLRPLSGSIMPNLLAEVFQPGEFLQEELNERQWSHLEFAHKAGVPAELVSEIIRDKHGISQHIAMKFGAALDQSEQYWLNLQNEYDQWRAEMSPKNPAF